MLVSVLCLSRTGTNDCIIQQPHLPLLHLFSNASLSRLCEPTPPLLSENIRHCAFATDLPRASNVRSHRPVLRSNASRRSADCGDSTALRMAAATRARMAAATRARMAAAGRVPMAAASMSMTKVTSAIRRMASLRATTRAAATRTLARAVHASLSSSANRAASAANHLQTHCPPPLLVQRPSRPLLLPPHRPHPHPHPHPPNRRRR